MIDRVRLAIARWLVPEIEARMNISAHGATSKAVASLIERSNADFSKRLPAMLKAAQERKN